MKTSKIGTDLIVKFETLSLKVYLDPGSPSNDELWTAGYGSLNSSLPPGESFKMGDTITKETAVRWRDYHITTVIEPTINRLVTVPITQEQFDVIVDFCFNLGTGAFESSTFLKRINAKNFSDAQKQITRFVNAGGRVMRGLQRRRLAEAVIFGGMNRQELIKNCFNGIDPEIKP